MAIYSVTRDDFAVEEEFAYNPGIEGALAIVAESEENYNKIMKAIGISELNYFEATGVEMVYEAGKIRALFDKVIEFFENLIKKVKAMYQRFVQWLDQYTKGGEEFVKKYETTIKNKDLTGFKYEGFKFDNLGDIKSVLFTDGKKAMGAVSEVFADATDLKDFKFDASRTKDGSAYTKSPVEKKVDEYRAIANSPDREDELRGEVFGNGGKVSAGEFTEKLFSFFRSGATGKKSTTTLDGDDVKESLTHIKSAKTDIANAKKAAKEVQEEIQKVITKLKTAKKKMENSYNTTDGGAVVSAVSACIKDYKTMMNLNVTIKGAYLSALRDRNRQARSMCFKALGYKAEKKL